MSQLLKEIYNETYLKLLSSSIHTIDSNFLQEKFIKAVFDDAWQNLELKQRMRHIVTTLNTFLPDEYERSIEILKKSFSQLNYSFNLENMIFQDYVELYGIEYFDISMQALEHFTLNSSSEFAIRQFILVYPENTMQQMSLWASSPNEHVRRLASEGCRPRLPWGIGLKAFQKDPSEILKIIDILKDDSSKYVQKSVANNLNDISKDNPNLVKKLTNKWINKNSTRDAILKHGCRTLLKQSDREILNIFGFTETKHIHISNFTMTKTVLMGETLHFSFSLKSQNTLGKLRVEFALFFLRKNGTHNKKVFKISEGVFKNNFKEFHKTYSFKKITTRSYYKGKHQLHIIINGNIFTKEDFLLI